ncbi:MAG: A/G-specific adenine glycosylase [Acidobacteriota bacterium]|jgi:A/G-specific adenine glycosylase
MTKRKNAEASQPGAQATRSHAGAGRTSKPAAKAGPPAEQNPPSPPDLAPAAPHAFPLHFSPLRLRRQLKAWYTQHARALPWRGARDPYAIWLSEIMLQQTRVTTVMDRYVEFLHRFPTIHDLAVAEEEAVLALWSGLGYYRRARMLHRGAQFVEREFGGKLPTTAARLRMLPGVGDYTAAAIASIAFGQSVAVLDGNVERVLLRLLGQAEQKSTSVRAQLLQAAQQLMPPSSRDPARENQPGDHNQAMMELGALLCLPRAPLCPRCPVWEMCKTRGEHPTAPRTAMQSRTVAHLLALRKRGVVTEVLLERRPMDAGLLPGMAELPPLPLHAVHGREPILRLRHAITNTNYYVQVFSEGVKLGGHSPASLLARVLATPGERSWVATSHLGQQPLTGVTRKTLQRLNLMSVPKVAIQPPA